MLGQRLVTVMNHAASLRIGDDLLVVVLDSVYQPFLFHPLAALPMDIVPAQSLGEGFALWVLVPELDAVVNGECIAHLDMEGTHGRTARRTGTPALWRV
jgi:hypothetical protein